MCVFSLGTLEFGFKNCVIIVGFIVLLHPSATFCVKTLLEFGLFLLHDPWKQTETIAAARVLAPGIYIMDIDVTEKVTNKSF